MITISRVADLGRLTRVENLSGVTFTGEDEGHKFVITAMLDDAIVPLTGSVSGKFIRPGGYTVALTEAEGYAGIDDGKAWVSLAGNCYSEAGPFGLTITHIDGEKRTVIYACAGYVRPGETSSIVDPESLINVDAITGMLADLQEAIEEAEGITDVVDELKSAMMANYTEFNDLFVWEKYGYDGDGKTNQNTKRIRTAGPTNVFNGIIKCSGDAEAIVTYYSEYTASAATCVGNSGDYSTFIDLNNAVDGAVFFRITVRTTGNDTLTNLVDETAAKVKIYASTIEINKKDTAPVTYDYGLFEIGSISSSSGANTNPTAKNRCRTVGYFDLKIGDVISVASGYKLSVNEYHLVNDAYVFDGVMKSLAAGSYTITENGTYRLVLANSDDSTITAATLPTVVAALTITKANESGSGDAVDVFDSVCMFNALARVEQGALATADNGRPSSNNYRARTKDFWVLAPTNIKWNSAETIEYSVFYYDRNFNFISSDGWSRNSRMISANTVAGAYYFKILLKKTNSGTFPADYDTVPETCQVLCSYPLPLEGYVRDVPKNDGVMNMVCRALQGAEIKYTTAAVLPDQPTAGSSTDNDFPANTEVTGIVYSSVRNEKLWVPNCVSFHSFMTALKSPNSYIYTRQSTTPNSKTYMGTVCSSYVCYCLDLPAVFTTHQIGELDSIERLEHQTPYALELGDILLRIDSHIRIVTDIIRDTRGRIIKIGISEAVTPCVETNYRTPEWVQGQMDGSNYRLYRYKDIVTVGYTASQWVAVDNERPTEPVYNTNLCPRRGDKSNWPEGETVEIDVLDAGDYTQAKLFKGETLVDTKAISTVLSYANLEYGSYKVCLTDGTNDSDFVYFIVVNNAVTVADRGNGTARVSFSSANATPVWLDWCESNSSDSDYKASYHAEVITDADRTAGYRDTTYEAGTHLFDVEFRTEYGVMSSTLVSATIT